MSAIVTLQVPFESLVEAVRSLSLEEKQKLVDILEDAILEAEEDLEDHPEVLAEVEEARKAYREQKLVDILEDAILEAEEDLEDHPEVLAEVEEARKAYREGNYKTIQEYIAGRSRAVGG